MPAGRAELGIGRGNRHRVKPQPGFGHLRGHGPLPDHVVHAGLAPERPSSPAVAIWSPAGRMASWASWAFLVFVANWRACGDEEAFAVVGLDPSAGGVERLLRQDDAVGTHVGDVAVFIQPLGDLHRLACAEAELAVGLLLQGAGGEGGAGRRTCSRCSIFETVHGFGLEPLLQVASRLFIKQQDVGPGREPAPCVRRSPCRWRSASRRR